MRAASRLCMQVADGGPARLEKGGREPVTLADYGSQAIILGMISAEFPDHVVLAEEGAPHLLDHSDDGIRSDLAALVAKVTGGACTIDKYAAVAAGLAETYIRPRNREDWRERAWDHAAGAAIVAGAGGRVTDLDGRDLDFSAGATLDNNRGVLAANGLVHELMLEVLVQGD